jgi:large subunit ribosomal protein L14e
VYTHFVEVGRVVQITYGPEYGKYAVIVDIIDQSRALVDGPTSGVKRQPLAFRRLQLTDMVVKIPRTIGTASLKKALEKESFDKKWKESKYSKTYQIRAKRAALSDFDRFKVMLAKKQRRAILRKA